MKVIKKEIYTSCEWCDGENEACDLLIYGEKGAKLICQNCLESLKEFLEEIGVKWAEV